jgi:hypothetical protein
MKRPSHLLIADAGRFYVILFTYEFMDEGRRGTCPNGEAL